MCHCLHGCLCVFNILSYVRDQARWPSGNVVVLKYASFVNFASSVGFFVTRQNTN